MTKLPPLVYFSGDSTLHRDFMSMTDQLGRRKPPGYVTLAFLSYQC